MRSLIADDYRLKPDHRFLLAIAELDQLVLGRSLRPVAAVPTSEGWRIALGSESIGTLPLLPGFRDIDSLLTRRARQLLTSTPLETGQPLSRVESDSIDAALDDFFVPRTAAALQEIGRLWGRSHRAELVGEAARGLVALAIQMQDKLEVGDALPAKALAATALATIVTPRGADRMHALLAETMGYTGEAIEYGRGLPPTDPVRLFVERRTRELGTLMPTAGADRLARYLYLIRLSDNPDPEAWLAWKNAKWTGSIPTTGVLGSGLPADWFGAYEALPDSLAGLVAWELATAAGPPGRMERISTWFHQRFGSARTPVPTQATPLSGYGSGLMEVLTARLSHRFSGPFLDGPTYAAYFKGQFFSVLYAKAHQAVEMQGSLKDVGELAATLRGSPEGPGAAVEAWVEQTRQLLEGSLPPMAALQNIGRGPSPGEPLWAWTYENATARLGFSHPMARTAARQLARTMDARVSHLEEMGHLALNNVQDLRVADLMMRRVTELAAPDHGWQVLWYAYFSGHQADIPRALADSSLRESDREAALAFLAEASGMADDVVRAEFSRMIRERPTSWNLRDLYAGYLIRHSDLAEALKIVSGWIGGPADGQDLMVSATARTRQAFLLDETGRSAEAWSAIAPALIAYKGETLARGALILAHLGHAEQAESLAFRRMLRYPSVTKAKILPAEIYWIAGKNAPAASWLVDHRHQFGNEEWTEVGEAFVRTFRKRPLEDAERALSELVRRGLSGQELGNVSRAAGLAGRNDLAFAAEAGYRGEPGLQRAYSASRAYSYLKQWRGQIEALKWIREALPPEVREPASMIFYRDKQNELLWDLIVEPGPGDNGQFAWLMRAAAASETGLAQDPHREQLTAYYNRPGDNPYFVMGRHLMGLASEADMLALATTPDRRCEVAYYLGLRAKAEGRYADATAWFLVTLETGQTKEGEYIWAADQLFTWADQKRSLELLQSEAAVTSSPTTTSAPKPQ